MDTKDLYDKNAQKWVRSEAVSLSDFTGRIPVLKHCSDLTSKKVLDMGCGEGYVSRCLLSSNPESIVGVDISSAMIQSAVSQNSDPRLAFEVGDATQLRFADEMFDLVVAVFVYNYVSTADMTSSMREVKRVLRKGGQFIFTVPHPFLPFIAQKSETFHFDFKEDNYFTARDKKVDGVIKRRDGVSLPVQMSHRTVADYLTSIKDAEFDSLPDLEELTATDELVKLDPVFFGPVHNKPLHMLFSITK